VFATNTATNTLLATNERLTGATNSRRDEGLQQAAVAVSVGDVQAGVVDAGSAVDRPGILPGAKTANRRSRDSYNAYQREYMRKRRAKPNSDAV
jgi:hypothetical protein